MSAQWINLKLFLPLCHQKCGFCYELVCFFIQPKSPQRKFKFYQNMRFPQVQIFFR